MKQNKKRLDGEPISVKEFLKSLEDAEKRQEQRRQKQKLKQPNRLDGKPYTKEETESFFKKALEREVEK
ncbi:hypothetical protein ERX37_07715 [Macrococcus hajekii]|uniref:Uncharacterized protein n=1 Tax=Macrococcus hajekii TaxID=198482 RepID=A0A4R6BK29_9STAP|nr:hypothetical protein [Macrococcus hajekii]TDM02079.1 hypothetical protein ERX37_07715 [Macrococcus hajekii]GGB09938.1 hypothetical protein GCM10007190_17480 [Macrococcus hajekii]